MKSVDDFARLLSGILEPDGFSAHVLGWPTHGDRRIRIELVARDTSCEDCLVPKQVMRTILQKQLELDPDIDVELVYPADRRSMG